MSLWERVPDRVRPPLRDGWNVLRHGRAAPRYAERIWVRPADCADRVGGVRRLHSGRVAGGEWDRRRASVETHPKVLACIQRWGHGRSWEDAGAYDEMLRLIAERGVKDGCATIDDVVRRYRLLDEVFTLVRAEGRLRTRQEVDPGEFRELGGVLINIDRHCRPVAGGGGWHRLAMARLLDLDVMPAQVGVVHRDALRGWRAAYSAAGGTQVG